MKCALILAGQLLSIASLASDIPVPATPEPASRVQIIDVAPAWSGHPVGFALLTQNSRQFIAFYDASRQLTLGERSLGDTSWKFKKLPTFVGWDSHNYISMALDRDNCLHVSGNMHAVPLVYFRGTVPLDIESVEPVAHMTGRLEDKVTYPKFIKGPGGELIFSYREGSSGDGDNLLNIYDEKSKTWARVLQQSLFDGENLRNAYPSGPELGPDLYYHMVWLWRETPDVETNHNLCYARSKDLVHWETIDGKAIALPITLETPGVAVDPIPPMGGAINTSIRVGFDRQKELTISYLKYDAKGNNQLYLARFENGQWNHYQATDWDYRWKFFGGGSLPYEIAAGAVRVIGDKLAIMIHHIKYGSGLYEVDSSTWHLRGRLSPPETQLPPVLTKAQSSFPGMSVQWSDDSGQSTSGTAYRLHWESLGLNRDTPRSQPWPDPVMLKLIEITNSNDAKL